MLGRINELGNAVSEAARAITPIAYKDITTPEDAATAEKATRSLLVGINGWTQLIKDEAQAVGIGSHEREGANSAALELFSRIQTDIIERGVETIDASVNSAGVLTLTYKYTDDSELAVRTAVMGIGLENRAEKVLYSGWTGGDIGVLVVQSR